MGSLFAAWEQGLSLAQVLGLPASSATSPGAADNDEMGAFDDWPLGHRAAGLAIVPTTVLDQRAS